MNRFLPRLPGSVARLLFFARISFSLSTLRFIVQTFTLPCLALISMTVDVWFSFRPGAHGKVPHSDRRRREGQLIHPREQSPWILSCAIHPKSLPHRIPAAS